jgi:hypothetical protein
MKGSRQIRSLNPPPDRALFAAIPVVSDLDNVIMASLSVYAWPSPWPLGECDVGYVAVAATTVTAARRALRPLGVRYLRQPPFARLPPGYTDFALAHPGQVCFRDDATGWRVIG